MFTQHFVVVHVVGGGHLHGGTDEALRTGEVETGAHTGFAKSLLERLNQGLVASMHAQFGDLALLEVGEKVMAGKGFLRVEQGNGLAQLGHFIQQAQHGATAAALAGDNVLGSAEEGAQLVVDRPALYTCD
ncbi:hypothetical protein D3C85_1185030 [compost metagenome]